ncbi:signal peptide-containing protein [Cryptosporidium canis]|nr:signal peptide-containing protein [Cryptosporidium canis]
MVASERNIRSAIRGVLHVLLILQVGMTYVNCIVEKIDSRTPSGSNAYIWLIKSPNILSQNINDPTRYSYGLLPGSIISLDLEFDYWEYPEDSGASWPRNESDAVNGSFIGKREDFKVGGGGQKWTGNTPNPSQAVSKRQLLTSSVPLIRFEDLPVSCVFSLKPEEVNRLVGNLNIASSSDIFIGVRWRNDRVVIMLKRLIRQFVLYWRALMHYLIPKSVSKSIERRCQDYFSEKFKGFSGSKDLLGAEGVILNLKERISDKVVSEQKTPMGIGFGGQMAVADGVSSKKELRNVFVLLLNGEQLTSLSHSPVQDLAFLSFSEIYPRFNISSYIRSILRVPIRDRSLKLEYKVPKLDRYTLLVVNGDRVPLHIRGKVIVRNPFPLHHLSFERRMDQFVVDFMMTVYIVTIVGYLVYSIYSSQALVQTYGAGIYLKFNTLQIIGLLLLTVKPICLYFDKLNVIAFTQFGNVKFSSWFIPRILARCYETLFIMYMLLISLGWKVLRDSLLSMEAKLLIGFFTLLFYLGVFEVILGIFQIARYIFQAVASLCIVIATNINTTLLQNTISDQSISPRLGILYNKWGAYSSFKWVFGLFILKPSMLFLCRVFALQPNGFDDWIYTLFDSMLDYFILLSTMHLFKPFKSMKLFSQVLTKHYSTSNHANNSNINHGNTDVSMWPVAM